MGNGEYLLEMKGIDKQFPGTHALDHVDFRLRRGEVHALIGQNGSGKSTLMNILSGSLHMDEGEILRNGRLIHISSPITALKNGIAMIHQELKLFPDLTVAENIYFGRYPYSGGKIDWKKLYCMADEAMAMLSKDIKGKDKIRTLSVAQQQLVEIVRAIVKKTEVIIMDEPTASLTDEETKMLFRVIEQVKTTGVSIIFISHRLDEILQISDSVTVLRDGVLIGTLKKEEIHDKQQLVDMMINIKIKTYASETLKETGKVVLEIKDICLDKRLNHVSLQLHEGEILGIAGLVGAGRTELLKTIFGAYRQTQGTLLIQGKNILKNSPEMAVKNGISYMSEDRKSEGLLLKMSIQDNEIYASLNQYMRYGLMNLKKRAETVKTMKERLRLKMSSPKELVGSLSGGNQQKVVIAKWLAANSSIILMDEPTRGIDVGAKSEIYALIRELAQEGKSIIFVSSELEEVQIVSDRILVMKEGVITKELPANSTVEEMMRYAV